MLRVILESFWSHVLVHVIFVVTGGLESSALCLARISFPHPTTYFWTFWIRLAIVDKVVLEREVTCDDEAFVGRTIEQTNLP